MCGTPRIGLIPAYGCAKRGGGGEGGWLELHECEPAESTEVPGATCFRASFPKPLGPSELEHLQEEVTGFP